MWARLYSDECPAHETVRRGRPLSGDRSTRRVRCVHVRDTASWEGGCRSPQVTDGQDPGSSGGGHQTPCLGVRLPFWSRSGPGCAGHERTSATAGGSAARRHVACTGCGDSALQGMTEFTRVMHFDKIWVANVVMVSIVRECSSIGLQTTRPGAQARLSLSRSSSMQQSLLARTTRLRSTPLCPLSPSYLVQPSTADTGGSMHA